MNLTLEEFKEWLESLPRNQVLREDGSCPVQSYLRSGGYPDAGVGYNGYWLEKYTIEYPMTTFDVPENIQDAIDSIDMLEKPWRVLTAGEVLDAIT